MEGELEPQCSIVEKLSLLGGEDPGGVLWMGVKGKSGGGKIWRKMAREKYDTHMEESEARFVQGEGGKRGREVLGDSEMSVDGAHSPSPMSLLNLNCRGLCYFSTVNNLRGLTRRQTSALIFLSETKLSCAEFSKVLEFMRSWVAFIVYLWIL